MILNRPTGVHVPAAQRAETLLAEPSRVLKVAPLEHYAVEYTDGSGKVHVAVWLRMGDRLYEPPSVETWAQSLRVVSDDFRRQFEDRIEHSRNPAAGIPEPGAVDILASK